MMTWQSLTGFLKFNKISFLNGQSSTREHSWTVKVLNTLYYLASRNMQLLEYEVRDDMR